MSRRRALLALLSVAGVIAAVGVALAFWSSTGSASTTASTLSLNAPANPQASATGTTVGVSWAAAKLTDDTTPATGYYVTRTNTKTSVTSNACGSSPAAPLAAGAVSCNDTTVPSGTYTYRVTAVFHSWTAASAATGAVTISAGAISLTPSTGNVGDSVSISGSGFPANTAITATYDGNAITLSPALASTDGTGAIAGVSFTVPASTAGSHTVLVNANGQTATALYTVTPKITLTPSSGIAGASGSISGTGFAAGSAITATFGGSPVTLGGTSTTDAEGSFSGTSYTVPNQAPGGALVAVTDAAANSGSATYTINTPSITLTSGSGNVGATTNVSGSNFPASSAVTITYDGTTVSSSATTNGSGAFSGASITVPASTAGSHTVAATVLTRSASATYTVTPKIVLSPTTGVAGTSDTVTGTGFAAGSAVTATFGGSAVTLTGGTTNANGSFSATYTVPNQAPGAKAVVATDASSNSDTASFTIPTPSITLGASTGNVGDAVSVDGSNFPASSSLTATFNGGSVTVGGTTSTNAAGSFSGATLTVPAAPAGSRSVEFTAATRSASATYTVTPKITLSPASGFAGDTDTITGSGFAASSSVSATFGGAAVTLTGGATGANGGFSATYTVPNQTFGSKTVSATDASSNNATAPFSLHQASFVIDSPPATVTAGTSFNLSLRAILDGATDSTYTGNHALTITGASNSPNGSTPTKPSSATFTAGTATLPLTLVKAGTESLAITDGTRSVSSSLAVNSAGVTLAWDRSCPATIAKNALTAFTVLVPNDAFGNAFRRVGGLGVGIASSNTSNFPLVGTPLTITDGPADNSFSINESGNNKTTMLTMTVAAPFTAASSCVVNSSS